LGADTDTVANGDVLDILADADGLSYNFMTDAAGCGSIPVGQHVKRLLMGLARSS
jgi:hypothetical protein